MKWLWFVIGGYFTAGLFTAILALRNDAKDIYTKPAGLDDWITAILWWPMILSTKFLG